MLNGEDVLLQLDVQGAATVHKLLGQDVVFIFMVAKSEMALVKRLVERKTKSFGNIVCNFVICIVKYTHTYALGHKPI
jgi:guanylate kinase